MLNPPDLILGSSSKYRAKLLSRLQIPFKTATPDIDESTVEGEKPEHYIERITKAKADALLKQGFKNAILLTSDQCAVFNDQIIGKPHTANNAIKQLKLFSGKEVLFLTGLFAINTKTKAQRYVLSKFSVQFRQLSRHEIEKYIAIEQPLDCAGSFKCEGLGISLFQAMYGNDPTSLEGLPLIETCQSLRDLGLDPLA